MGFKNSIEIAGRNIGQEAPCYLIAEIGRNHNGDIGLAKQSIEAAVRAGADAVKFQSFRAEKLLIRNLESVSHVAETLGAEKSIYEATKEVELAEAAHIKLQAHAKSLGATFLSTPEDHDMVELLQKIDIPAFKIASLDIVYLDLVEAIAKTGKPIILSTGMSFLSEIEQALETLRKVGVEEAALLHCTSNYPPRNEDVNLRAMETLKKAFGVPVGYSDHTLGIGVSVAAAALGACIIERHFTLDKTLPGPDHRISLTEPEFAQMANEIRTVEAALGATAKRPCEAEMEMRRLHRRRLVAASTLEAGSILKREDIACKCSAEGLEPSEIQTITGKQLKADMNIDQPFSIDLFE